MQQIMSDPDRFVEHLLERLGPRPRLDRIAQTLATVEDGCLIYLGSEFEELACAASARHAAADGRFGPPRDADAPRCVLETIKSGLPRTVQLLTAADASAARLPWPVSEAERCAFVLVVPIEGIARIQGAFVLMRWRPGAAAFSEANVDAWRLAGFSLGPLVDASRRGMAIEGAEGDAERQSAG